jgi:glycosyltransferase involved in cell wall biosynthesis
MGSQLAEGIGVSTSNMLQNSLPIDISVVIPVFNEGKSIGKVLTMLSEINWSPYRVEVIAVDDGSTDNSPDKIQAFPWVKYIRHKKNIGKGAALKTGFQLATGKVVVIQDADMEYSPKSIPDLVMPILQGKADTVFGSRFTGNRKDMSLSHFVGNRLLTLSARILFSVPITDIMTGFKAFSRDVVDSFELKENGFEVEVEMTSKCLRNGWRYSEVPIDYSYRVFGTSKINFLDGITSLIHLISWSYKTSQNE